MAVTRCSRGGRLSCSRPFRSPIDFFVLFYLVSAAYGEGDPLVHALGLDVADFLLPGCCAASRLLCDHREGCAFVEEAQLSLGLVCILRVEVDAAPVKDLMKVGHEGSRVSKRIAVFPLRSEDVD